MYLNKFATAKDFDIKIHCFYFKAEIELNGTVY